MDFDGDVLMISLSGRSSSLLLCSSLFLAIGACSLGASLAQAPASSAASTTLTSKHLQLAIRVKQQHLDGLVVTDSVQRQTLTIAEAFTLVMKDGTELRSSALSITPKTPESTDSACWVFTSPEASFHWCAVMHPDADYMRETLTMTAGSRDLDVREVRMLDLTDASAHVDGTVKGSPVVSGGRFYALEHPLSQNLVTGGHVQAGIQRVLPLQAGQHVQYSAVIGISEPGQLRRAFLTYLERERPRPYQPFLHYNSWFDLGYTNRFDEAGALDRVHAFGLELVKKRNVRLDSFLFDDGWDDPNTLWGFNQGFPQGFARVGEAAAIYHAGVGAWLSPWGGYDKQKEERVAYGREHGYEILKNGYALSGPKYYEAFEQVCLAMLRDYHFNQFKFDGTGNADRVFPGSAYDSDFDAAIHLIERLRAAKPGLFINLTTGTTASPFWLFYADSIWRGGEDHDFAGVGSPRQRWITYRDGQTYKNIVQTGPLFPLNSLMLHGIIYAKSALDLSADPNDEFRDEVHSFFASGTQLQEMYITPKLLTAANWDTLAEGALWSRAHAETLKDVHWIGGDPEQLQVYGWAAWSPKEAILTLRNPANHPASYSVDVVQAFELPAAARGSYTFHSVWSPDNGSSHRFAASRGKALRITLAPYEVLTLAGRSE